MSSTNEFQDFTDALRAFMQRERRSNSDLASLTNISVRTIEKWATGETRRPRFVADVLKLAQSLALSHHDTSTLLRVAGHPPLEQLLAQAEQAQDKQLLPLLQRWKASPPAPAAPRQRASLHQLRAPTADFVGRRHELATLVAALQTANQQYGCICGIHGMGGIGKTELATRAVHEVLEAFPDGQLLVELHGASQTPLPPTEALRQCIRALGGDSSVPAAGDLVELQQLYRTLLHERRVLIVADDARDAEQVRPLIPTVGSALLLTSRQRFTLPGMASVHLEPLGDEALELLQAICKRLASQEALAIAQACVGLPLALRVSASVLHNNPALRVNQYVTRVADIRQRLHHLSDPDDRHHNVAASLALSYDLLDACAQQVFRQLGVFVADFDTALAAAVVAQPESTVEAQLHVLLRRNLVIYNVERERWVCHDLVRALALERLAEAGEEEHANQRYAYAVCAIGEETQVEYKRGGEGVVVALQRFDMERPHIDAAWRWALDHKATDAGGRLLVALAHATDVIGRLRYHVGNELLPWLQEAVAAAQRLGNLVQVYETQCMLATIHQLLGEPQHSIALWEQVLLGTQALGDQNLEARTLRGLSNSLFYLGGNKNIERALDYEERALAIFRAQGDERAACIMLNNIGITYVYLRAFAPALAAYEEALALARRLGHREQQAMVLSNLGKAYTQMNEHKRAITVYQQSLALAREIQYQRGVGITLSCLSDSYVAIGQLDLAIATYEEALALLRTHGDQRNAAWCAWDLGRVLVQTGQRERGLGLMREALAHKQRTGYAHADTDAAELARLEAEVTVSAAPA